MIILIILLSKPLCSSYSYLFLSLFFTLFSLSSNVCLSVSVPHVLRSCSIFIEEHGIVDGIYRLSGVSSNTQKLRCVYIKYSHLLFIVLTSLFELIMFFGFFYTGRSSTMRGLQTCIKTCICRTFTVSVPSVRHTSGSCPIHCSPINCMITLLWVSHLNNDCTNTYYIITHTT